MGSSARRARMAARTSPRPTFGPRPNIGPKSPPRPNPPPNSPPRPRPRPRPPPRARATSPSRSPRPPLGKGLGPNIVPPAMAWSNLCWCMLKLLRLVRATYFDRSHRITIYRNSPDVKTPKRRKEERRDPGDTRGRNEDPQRRSVSPSHPWCSGPRVVRAELDEGRGGSNRRCARSDRAPTGSMARSGSRARSIEPASGLSGRIVTRDRIVTRVGHRVVAAQLDEPLVEGVCQDIVIVLARSQDPEQERLHLELGAHPA